MSVRGFWHILEVIPGENCSIFRSPVKNIDANRRHHEAVSRELGRI
jgi:hypothetical protein